MAVGPVISGIPVPAPKPHKVYPFAELEVGQSFSVDVARGEPTAYVQSKVNSAAYKFFGGPGHVRTQTVRPESGNVFIRCWRIK